MKAAGIMHKKTYWILLSAIVALGFFLRFWNLPNRIVIYADSARDAIFAQAALAEGKIPLIGSFSSSGPFVFGPTYYWFLIFMYIIMPFTSLAPWYGTAFLSVVSILFLADSGRRASGKIGGIVTGIITAFSPAQVFRSTSLTQHSLVGVSVSAALWSILAYAKKKSRKWIFISGLAVGIATSLHYQALSLFVLGGIIFVLQVKHLPRLITDFLIYFTGFLLPFIPLFYWDANQGWANLRNLMDFIFIGQYRIFISRRWLSFLTEFFPKTVIDVVGGGHIGIVLVLGGVGLILVGKLLIEKKLAKELIWIFLVLILQITVVRYARVDLYEGYLIFLHPLLIFIVGWLISETTKLVQLRYVAYLILIVLFISSLIKDVNIISGTNGFNNDLDAAIDTIVKSRPNQKFMLYDHKYASAEFSYPFSFLLFRRDLINISGTPLGICLWECPKNTGNEIMTMRMGNYYVISDLSATTAASLKPPMWFDVSPHNVLQEVGFWWKEKPMTSPFSIKKFLLGTLLRKDL